MLALAALLLTATPVSTPAKTCATVRGTYAIYVENAFLHIDHSRHMIELGADALDAALEKRGWQDFVVRGRFTVCGRRVTSPLNWNIHDRLDLVSYRNISFVPRPDR